MWMLFACAEDPPAPVETAPALLRAEGADIVDPDGQIVRLNGVNLGGWMFHETWITAVDYPMWGRFYTSAVAVGFEAEVTSALLELGPTESLDVLEAAFAERVGAEVAAEVRATTEGNPSVYDDSDLPLRQVLERRFGTSGRDAILGGFQESWITDGDLDRIADLGFNVVRVPIGYRTLVTTSDEAALTELVWNEDAFARLEWLVDACGERDLYAVLDLQESPGGHNDYSGPATLYTDPDMQALTVELWQELSRRFVHRPEVAAYSLLAEPMSAPSNEARDAMYDQLHDAIRGQGDDHLLVIHDGFAGMYTLPRPGDMGWSNVVYSTHMFEWGAASEADYAALITVYDALFTNAQVEQEVPYFIGSFSTMEDSAWAYSSARTLVDWYDERGWSWAWWTWKRIDDPLASAIWGTRTGWGVLREPWDTFERPDVYLDDQAQLEAKFAAYDGELGVNEDVVAAIAPAARD